MTYSTEELVSINLDSKKDLQLSLSKIHIGKQWFLDVFFAQTLEMEHSTKLIRTHLTTTYCNYSFLTGDEKLLHPCPKKKQTTSQPFTKLGMGQN